MQRFLKIVILIGFFLTSFFGLPRATQQSIQPTTPRAKAVENHRCIEEGFTGEIAPQGWWGAVNPTGGRDTATLTEMFSRPGFVAQPTLLQVKQADVTIDQSNPRRAVVTFQVKRPPALYKNDRSPTDTLFLVAGGNVTKIKVTHFLIRLRQSGSDANMKTFTFSSNSLSEDETQQRFTFSLPDEGDGPFRYEAQVYADYQLESHGSEINLGIGGWCDQGHFTGDRDFEAAGNLASLPPISPGNVGDDDPSQGGTNSRSPQFPRPNITFDDSAKKVVITMTWLDPDVGKPDGNPKYEVRYCRVKSSTPDAPLCNAGAVSQSRNSSLTEKDFDRDGGGDAVDAIDFNPTASDRDFYADYGIKAIYKEGQPGYSQFHRVHIHVNEDGTVDGEITETHDAPTPQQIEPVSNSGEAGAMKGKSDCKCDDVKNENDIQRIIEKAICSAICVISKALGNIACFLAGTVIDPLFGGDGRQSCTPDATGGTDAGGGAGGGEPGGGGSQPSATPSTTPTTVVPTGPEVPGGPVTA